MGDWQEPKAGNCLSGAENSRWESFGGVLDMGAVVEKSYSRRQRRPGFGPTNDLVGGLQVLPGEGRGRGGRRSKTS